MPCPGNKASSAAILLDLSRGLGTAADAVLLKVIRSSNSGFCLLSNYALSTKFIYLNLSQPLDAVGYTIPFLGNKASSAAVLSSLAKS